MPSSTLAIHVSSDSSYALLSSRSPALAKFFCKFELIKLAVVGGLLANDNLGGNPPLAPRFPGLTVLWALFSPLDIGGLPPLDD